MAKKAATPAAKPKASRPWRPLLMVAGTLSLAALGYFAISWLGRVAGEAVAKRDAFQVRIDDLQCAVPPGMDRETFLTEVKYLGHPPKEFSLADPKARAVLAEAFAKHPWVQSATPSTGGSSPVTLVFRKPVLMVMVKDGPARLVDAGGVLLPSIQWPTPLPKLLTPQPGPLSPAGEIWLTPRLPRALEFVKDYDAWELRHTEAAWSFTKRDGKQFTLPLGR